MADRWGIEHDFVDATGQHRRISDETVDALRELIGEPPAGQRDPVLVVRPGDRRPVGPARLVLENGSEVEHHGELPGDLPLGYHRLVDDEGERRLIVSPGRCHLPEGWRAWGWAVQLYASRSRSSWGLGDLADLRDLARTSAHELGAGFILVNPLHAVAPTLPQEPSPYYPSSRRFLNPVYLRIEDVPGAGALGEELRPLAAAGRALNDDRRIDRDEVWRLKLDALERLWARSQGGGVEFDRWVGEAPAALDEFTAWCVLAEAHGPNWREWPTALRHPSNPAVAVFVGERYERTRFHAWLQWLTSHQLAEAGRDLALIQDLPIGVNPNGADAWAWQEVLAEGVSVGAPPDEFNSQGQNWGLPPFVPWRLRRSGYQPLIDTIRATIATAGGLRVDHVMGLFRLWWVPAAADPTDGAYVRYPADELLDIVALESHRAQAPVVGEDLGTVEPGVREAMAERRMLTYKLLWFEPDDPATWSPGSMAAVTTHDLPTVAGLWTGYDLAQQDELGLEPNTESTREIRERLARSCGLEPEASPSDAVRAAHELLGRSPSVLLTATLDDAVAEVERPNMPGADAVRDNWSLALPVPIDDLPALPLARGLAAILSEAVEHRPPEGNPTT
jgi:4-alpha-glucanotransferase